MPAELELSTIRIAGLVRYPVKGLNGVALQRAQLDLKHGIAGDRRFALGIEAAIDDGVWRSSRSYLINAANDGLLKFKLDRHGENIVVKSPSGEVAVIDPNDPGTVDAFNENIGSFLNSIPNAGKTPQLIDRYAGHGPRGHWDFPDSELLVVNLATLRELSTQWNLEIDYRRFRPNILIDGLPAWSEFVTYGAVFSIGSARIEILRPARRCAATTVNPDSGDRDIEIQKLLAQDYGHGFFGVYARVSRQGEIAVGDDVRCIETNALSQSDAMSEIAPAVSQWPKMAMLRNVENRDASVLCNLSPRGSWPLTEPDAQGRMRINIAPGCTVAGGIVSSSTATDVTVELPIQDTKLLNELNDIVAQQSPVSVCGPFGGR